MPCRSYIYFFIKCVAVGGCTLWLCVAKATHSFPKVFNFFFLKYTIISRHFSLACKTNKCNTFYFIFFTKCITFVLFYKLLKLTLLLQVAIAGVEYVFSAIKVVNSQPCFFKNLQCCYFNSFSINRSETIFIEIYCIKQCYFLF